MSFDWARPGIEVVCIDDDWNFTWYDVRGLRSPDRVPMLNEVLTVEQAIPHPWLHSGVGLRFEGIDPLAYWPASHFRPLVSRTIEDDIAIFAPLLHSQPEVA